MERRPPNLPNPTIKHFPLNRSQMGLEDEVILSNDQNVNDCKETDH